MKLIEQIVIIGGWGMPAEVCNPLAVALSSWSKVRIVPIDRNWSDLQKEIHAAVKKTQPGKTLVVGWSLGGSVALRCFHDELSRDDMQANPAGLVLLASNPCFISRKNWPGVDEDFFRGFHEQFEDSSEKCLKRFLGLQVKGSRGGLDELREITKSFSRASKHIAWDVLRETLEWLSNWDLRMELGSLNTPMLGLYGERDLLVSASLVQNLPALNAMLSTKTIKGMSHYPGLKWSEAVAREIKYWISE